MTAGRRSDDRVARMFTAITTAMPHAPMSTASACERRSSPRTMFAIPAPNPWAITRLTCPTKKMMKARRPRKWTLRAAWRPPSTRDRRGKCAPSAGDINIPLSITSGDNPKMRRKYVSCWSALYPVLGGRWRVAYWTTALHAPGIIDHEVGTSRRHSAVAISVTM